MGAPVYCLPFGGSGLDLFYREGLWEMGMFDRKSLLGLLALLLSIQAFGHAQLDEMLVLVNEELAESPESAPLYVKRGELYRDHEEFDKALADFDRAEKLDSTYQNYELHRGLVYLGMGKAELSVDYFTRAHQADPDNFTPIYYRARAYFRLERFAEACTDFDKAFPSMKRVTPGNILEHAQAHQNNPQTGIGVAIDRLESGLKRLGNVISLEMALVDLYAQAGDYKGGVELLSRIIGRGGRVDLWRMMRGDLYEKMGEAEKARVEFVAVSRSIRRLSHNVRNRKVNRDLLEQAEGRLLSIARTTEKEKEGKL